MQYLSVKEMAVKWRISERTVRNYCNQGRVPGAFLTGKVWNIPEDAIKPNRQSKRTDDSLTLLTVLEREKEAKLSGGIYHRVQIDLTYNSNHIEGSKLTHDQTRYIFETNTIGVSEGAINVNDIVETVNHFRCVDRIIEEASNKLSEKFIKELHYMLKNGSSDSRKEWFSVGDYKRLPNEVGGQETTAPSAVASSMKKLIHEYNLKKEVSFEDILEFHVNFERIHPFQDGNGRVGRLIMFKECLKHNIVPFIITENTKLFYYRGLKEWKYEKGYLMDTCLSEQDRFKKILDYFKISYNE